MRLTRTIRIGLVGLLILSTSSSTPAGEEIRPLQVLLPSDVPAGWSNWFGWSSAISGDYVAVGAPRDPWYNGNATGAVYVFRRYAPTWIEQAKLTVPDPVFEAQLGRSVAIDGDVIVAGAPSYEFTGCSARRPGAAYVFRRDDHGTPADPSDDSWAQEAVLTLSDPMKNRGLGMSVAIDGDLIVVGTDCGETAAVYRQSDGQWMHEASLTASDAQAADLFGLAVDVSGARVVVGAPRKAPTGSAYVFTRGKHAWVQEHQLAPSLPQGVEFFGHAVCLDGRYAIVGAPGTDGFWFNEGAAFVFSNASALCWEEVAALKASVPMLYAKFGSSVAMDGDLILVTQTDRPWAYLFGRESEIWRERGALLGPEPWGITSSSVNANFAVAATHIYAVRERRDLRDLMGFQSCFGAMVMEANASCGAFDLTSDSQVQLDDLEVLLGTLVGP